MEAVYCQEEGVEGLHQSYINIHGLCRLPRAHADSDEKQKCETREDSNSGKKQGCKKCRKPEFKEDPEVAFKDKFQHCQKGQYMLVRVPPHCNVNWQHGKDFNKKFRRYHSQESRREKVSLMIIHFW